MLRAAASLLSCSLLATAFAPAAQVRVASFNIGAHFTTSSGGVYYPDYSLGDPGTPDYESVRSILARINADVVALQEIHSADLPDDLNALAASLGYPHLHVPPVTNVFDTSLRVVFLSRFPFLTTDTVHSPVDAKDMTRLHPIVKVDVPGTNNDPVLVSVHLKSGTLLADRFQRAVEMKRLTGYLSAAGLTNADNLIVLGDFNPSSTNATFTEQPASGLPGSFVLGNDITFPVTYSTDPLVYFSTPAVFRLDPRQPDGSASTYGTTSPGGPTLDLFLISPAIAGRPVAGEIYNSALDVSNFTGLPKSGDPLPSATSATASDHYAVFADLELDSAGSYVFGSSGETVTEDFSGFGGSVDPAPWSTTGGSGWRGFDDGSSATPGWRVYGSGPGFLADETAGVISATFVNQSPVPLTALEVAYDAGQWRALANGAADRMQVDLVTAGGTIPLPALTFTASPSPGVGNARLTAMAQRLWIAPGYSFELRVSFIPGDGFAPPPPDVFINEFHYDNNGDDSGEFVEVVVSPGFSGELSDIDIVFYNGGTPSAATFYRTLNLDNASHFTPGGTSSGYRIFSAMLPTDGIQNGGNDGFAVVNKATSQVAQLISYEGVFTAASGPAAGMTSTDIGVSQQTTSPTGVAALGLTGSGSVAGDFNWVKFSAGIDHSPGQANDGQVFVNPKLPPQGLGFDNLSVSFLTDNDLDGVPDINDSDDDNDGQGDAYETAFGTDPQNGASRFLPVMAKTESGLELSFPGAAGIQYTVECSDSLTGWEELTTVAGNGQPVVMPLPMAEPRMFFRVKAGGP